MKGCTETQYRFNEVDNYRATPTLNVFAEYQLRKSLSLHVEADNTLQQRYNRVVNIYAGPRNTFPLSYQDDRSLTSSASVLFMMRTASAKFVVVSGCRDLPSTDTAAFRSATTSAMAAGGSSIRAGSIRLGDSIDLIEHIGRSSS
ncbi:MAG: hypothetical protein M3Y50_04680 [Acidobacteriota bacterium]|nr:hypothetical protein [Acidobacteriota bacterium]